MRAHQRLGNGSVDLRIWSGLTSSNFPGVELNNFLSKLNPIPNGLCGGHIYIYIYTVLDLCHDRTGVGLY